jgi:hypothetical protein
MYELRHYKSCYGDSATSRRPAVLSSGVHGYSVIFAYPGVQGLSHASSNLGVGHVSLSDHMQASLSPQYLLTSGDLPYFTCRFLMSLRSKRATSEHRTPHSRLDKESVWLSVAHHLNFEKK